MYFGLFVARRIIYMMCFKFLVDYPVLQLQITAYMNMLVMIYQGSQTPIASRLRNQIENMNEFFIIIATLHMMFYTDWIPEKEV